MLKCKIEAGLFKNFVDSVLVLRSESVFVFGADKLSSSGTDPAKVAMVVSEINLNGFIEYTVSGWLDEKADGFLLGLDVVHLSSVLSMASSVDVISLYLDEDKHKFNILFNGMTFTLSLIDPSAIREAMKRPELEHPFWVKLTGSALQFGVKAAERVAEYVYLEVVDGVFQIRAEGDADAVKSEIKKDTGLIALSSENPGNLMSLFALDYLKNIAKVLRKQPIVKISLGTDIPFVIEGFFDGGCNVVYMLAPRVESV